ncbi:hypothetical protein HPP92_017302 [Vanilla planifolia]|uniref:Uncharacterized protein n=1 Tax=Vanilla planifolia TaxID=51239 RepID=A0A835Q920_VANPL|nr:hypothetical protein HPP92_017302 [Vanilla planifolia]
MAFPVHHDQCSASIFGVHPSKVSPPHFSSQWQDKSLNRNINNLHQLDRDRNAYRVPLTSEHTNYQQASDHRLGISGPFDDARSSFRMLDRDRNAYRVPLTSEHTNYQQASDHRLGISGPFDDARSSFRMVVKDSWISSDDGSDFKECFDGQQTRSLSTSSAGIYQSGLDNLQRRTMPFHHNFSKEPSRTLAIVADSCYQEMQPFPDHLEHGYTKEKGQGNDRSHMFPITYKRKNHIQSSVQLGTLNSHPQFAAWNQQHQLRLFFIKLRKLSREKSG